MKLSDLLNLNKSEKITIVGAGGKTTCLFTLADELKENNVLVTTTTKIYEPNKNMYDRLILESDNFDNINFENGITVFGKEVDSSGKLLSPSKVNINKISDKFDYILIEGDGSKEKPLKGWNDEEPVVLEDTTITLGILSIKNIGKKVNEKNIHRLKEFMTLTNSKEEDEINIKHLADVVNNPEGIFKNSQGKKILLINGVETKKEVELARLLLVYIGRNTELIILGSLKEKNFKVLKK